MQMTDKDMVDFLKGNDKSVLHKELYIPLADNLTLRLVYDIIGCLPYVAINYECQSFKVMLAHKNLRLDMSLDDMKDEAIKFASTFISESETALRNARDVLCKLL